MEASTNPNVDDSYTFEASNPDVDENYTFEASNPNVDDSYSNFDFAGSHRLNIPAHCSHQAIKT